jgi:terpene synthase-like protein
VSKSHQTLRETVEEVELASLFRRFEQEYGRPYARLVAQLRQRYPEITRPGRRTGRALRNICFIVWCCCRHRERKLIPTLFRAAILLSAQDDYYDNARIPAAQKDSFCAAINHALRTDSFRPGFQRSRQLRDLSSLWSYVARTIPRSDPRVKSFWIETACQLNDAMAAENRSVRRRGTITYDEYMGTATESIGMVFIWATYLAHEHLPTTTMREMGPVLLHGARVVRLSNDMASYRQRRNRTNALTLLGGRNPGARIHRIVMQESRAFRERVEALTVRPQVRSVLLQSMELFREFYQRSDFDRGRSWSHA